MLIRPFFVRLIRTLNRGPFCVFTSSYVNHVTVFVWRQEKYLRPPFQEFHRVIVCVCVMEFTVTLTGASLPAQLPPSEWETISIPPSSHSSSSSSTTPPHLGLLSPELKPCYSYTLIFAVVAPPTHEHVSSFQSSVFYLPNIVSIACRVCQIPFSLKTLLCRSLSSFHDHKDDLRKRLSYTTHKLEMVETEFDSTRQYLETELRRAQEELEKFTEKLRRCVCVCL